LFRFCRSPDANLYKIVDGRSGRFEQVRAEGNRLDSVSEPPPRPFRVKRENFAGPPLTQSQQRVLSALVALCPDAGCDVDARAVSEAADLRLGSVVVVLRSLEKRKLALMHEGDPEGWAPTLTGRSRVRHFRAAEQPAKPKEP
jgi:hypothetical protein